MPADEASSVRAERSPRTPRSAVALPLQEAAGEWLRTRWVRCGGLGAGHRLRPPTTAALADRPVDDWLRTYRDHERGDGPLDGPGRQDITCEVAVDQLVAAVGAPVDDRTQPDWLRHWGIDGLVEEGRRVWEERAGVGDLEALRARAASVEAEALTDPTGLGAFRVLEWRVD